LVLGAKDEIDYEILNKLEYTSCVIKESLRKWPPAAAVSRQTSENVYLDGYFLPKDTWIMASPFVSGRIPDNFPEPNKFIPDRFLKDSEYSKINK
jgi:cytochrome P450